MEDKIYAVIVNGAAIDYCKEPRYVRLNESNNTWVECTKDIAQCIAVLGTRYTLPTMESIEGVEQAVLIEREIGTTLFNTEKVSSANERDIITNQTAVEETLTTMDSVNDARFLAIEDYICTLDMAMAQNESAETPTA